MIPPTNRRLIASLVVAAGLPLARPACGTILNWNNPLGGPASTAGNWNPAQAPTAADDLTFNLNALYTVTFDASSASSRTHTYRIGTQTIVCSAPHTVSTGIVVGSASPDIADVTLTTGTLNSTSSVTIGNGNLAQGTLRINDDDADLIITGAGADLTVGSNGIGSLLITGGGLAVVPDQLIAGNNASSVSTLTVSGALAVSPFTRSTLDVNGTSSSRLGQGGDATVSIASGALATFAGDVVVSNGSASTSTVAIGGTGGIGGIHRATLDIAGNLDVGRNVSATVAAGAATVTVNSGGTLDVAGTLNLGNDPDGGSGTLVLNTGGQIDVGSLAVGSAGTLDLNGGTLDVNAGALSSTTPLVIGGPSNPVVTLLGGASHSQTVAPGSTALIVGGGSAGADSADLDVRSGSDISIPVGNLTLGDGATDSGSMILNGAGSTLSISAGNVRVGLSGTGRLEAELGASIVARDVFVGSLAGADGILLVENAGTTAQCSSLGVGGTAAVAGGTGLAHVNADAVMTLTSDSLAARVHSGGTLHVDRATLDSAGDIEVLGGTLELSGDGLINAPSARVLVDAGQVLGHPLVASPDVAVINAPFEAINGAVIRAVNGDLTLGDATNPNGFRAISIGADSLIDCGTRTILMRSLSFANIDDATLAGGVLASNASIVTSDTSSISGFGTIDAPSVFSSGTLTPTGASGLRFTGRLVASSASISGTLLGFNSGATLEGQGVVACDIDADAGSTLLVTGPLTIGRSTSAFGCVIEGTLLCQNHAVTLLDLNGIGLGTLTDLGTASGVRLISSVSLQVGVGRTIQGRGTVQTPLLSVFGNIKPGDTVFFNSDPIPGVIGVTGNCSMSANAHYHCEIGDPTEGTNHDRISVSGSATVNGTIHARLFGGFVPQVGDFFDVVTGTTRSGAFHTEDCPGFSVVYLADRVRLVFQGLPCDGDLNCDGNVDQDDVDALIATVAGDPQNFCAPDADINHDGNVDQDDVDAFIQFVAGGPCP